MWAAPVIVLVLAASVSGGVAARAIYPNPAQPAQPTDRPSDLPRPTGDRDSALVRLSEAAARHPDHEAVRTLLRSHFKSINLLRYEQWSSTVVPAKRRRQPEGQWRSEYGSTQDSSVRVRRIVPGPEDSLMAMLSFTSTQKPSDAPKEMPVDCLRWQVTYRLVRHDGGLRLGTGRPASSLYRPC